MEYAWWIGIHSFLARAEVAPWEVMEVLYSSRRWARPARTREGLPVTTVWGRTEAGRPLVVMLRPLPSPPRVPAAATDTWEILMAAQMRPHQLEEYTAWEANR
ncbi:hypothetical protein [Nocardia veterana]|uniref:Uncharacterized protein n=1 Tax=Nocardia veterana TaxID=132249 RepID=A0A7X6M0B4_9NOCA|nr:hypothetical protein [Nocardia veterana]NKY87945.1 hypothetical protein [Nocardia veterana]